MTTVSRWTGEKKYADLGRECFEWAFRGLPNHDKRYSFMNPGGALRAASGTPSR